MKLTTRRLLAFAVLCATVAGCSTTFETKKVDYKSAGKVPPLEVPPDLTVPTRDDRYAVPDITPRSTATYSAYKAERAGQPRTSTSPEILPQVDKLRIERSGTQRWLVVGSTPDRLWPQIKEFWQSLGFIVSVEQPESGILETDWAENRAKLPMDPIRSVLGKVLDQVYSTSELDKFRTRLEPGAQPGTTEVYISHRGMSEVFVTEGRDQTMWQPRPPDPDLEAEMLRLLMVRLGADEQAAKGLLADARPPDRARLIRTTEGPGSLELQEAFDRAWRRVGLALDRVGFTVEDRDRSQGVYFVRYVDPEADAKARKKEEGFLSRLMFWRSDKPVAPPSAQFRIHVKGQDQTSVVQVLTREGGVDSSDSANRILSLLFDQLK